MILYQEQHQVFTIPMRGNEPGTGLSRVKAEPEFTIPMRGNERKQAAEELAETVEVYDPHEG